MQEEIYNHLNYQTDALIFGRVLPVPQKMFSMPGLNYLIGELSAPSSFEHDVIFVNCEDVCIWMPEIKILSSDLYKDYNYWWYDINTPMMKTQLPFACSNNTVSNINNCMTSHPASNKIFEWNEESKEDLLAPKTLLQDNNTMMKWGSEDFSFENPKSQKRPSNMTKSKVNMKLLKDYRCSVEKRANEKGGITTVYTWLYSECGKEFTRAWSILDHVRMHEGVRPYVWKFWNRSYTQKGNMIKHMIKHTEPEVDNRRSYTCEFWNRGYTEKYNLKVKINKRTYIKSYLIL